MSPLSTSKRWISRAALLGECTNWATSFLSIKETSETEKIFFVVVIYIFSYKNSFYKLFNNLFLINSERCYWHEYIRTAAFLFLAQTRKEVNEFFLFFVFPCGGGLYLLLLFYLLFPRNQDRENYCVNEKNKTKVFFFFFIRRSPVRNQMNLQQQPVFNKQLDSLKGHLYL
jgi:hypothetical protein